VFSRPTILSVRDDTTKGPPDFAFHPSMPTIKRAASLHTTQARAFFCPLKNHSEGKRSRSFAVVYLFKVSFRPMNPAPVCSLVFGVTVVCFFPSPLFAPPSRRLIKSTYRPLCLIGSRPFWSSSPDFEPDGFPLCPRHFPRFAPKDPIRPSSSLLSILVATFHLLLGEFSKLLASMAPLAPPRPGPFLTFRFETAFSGRPYKAFSSPVLLYKMPFLPKFSSPTLLECRLRPGTIARRVLSVEILRRLRPLTRLRVPPSESLPFICPE